MCKYTRMSKMNVKKEKAVSFLNSARLTSPPQNTWKFTKFTAIGEAWNSMKNHFLSKCELSQ